MNCKIEIKDIYDVLTILSILDTWRDKNYDLLKSEDNDIIRNALIEDNEILTRWIQQLEEFVQI